MGERLTLLLSFSDTYVEGKQKKLFVNFLDKIRVFS